LIAASPDLKVSTVRPEDVKPTAPGVRSPLKQAGFIGILFGWTLGGILPTDQRISWQAHLFGLIGGVVAAILFRRKREETPIDPLGSTVILPPQ